MIVQFLSEGEPVTGGTDDNGTYIIPFFGSQTTWTNVSYTFDDPLTETPDECIIAFACNDVINETGFVGDFMEIDNIVLQGTTETVPGGDFDNWVEVDNGESADDWDTYIPGDFGFINKVDADPFEGTYNVRMETLEIFDDTIQSMIYQGDLQDEGFFPSEPIPANAFALDFQYKYSNLEADSATVYFIFSEELEPEESDIAFFVERLGPQENWTNYTIDFSEVPISANYYGVMFFSGLGFDEYNAPGSILQLDAVGFLTGDDCEFSPTINEGDVVACPNDGTFLSTQEYDEYNWWVSETGMDDFEIVSSDSILPSDTGDPGIYDIYLAATLDGCTAFSDTVLVEIVEIPTPEASVDGEIILDVCAGETVTIEIENADDFDSFQWKLLGFDIPFATDPTYDALAVLDLSSIFICEVTIAECPDNVIQSNGVTVNSHSAPFLIISQDGNTLSVDDGFEDYQWYLDGDPISGATFSSYEINQDGNYTVTASNEWDCEGESLGFDATYTLVDENYLEALKFYPNPVNDVLNISGLPGVRVVLEINDLSGKQIVSEQLRGGDLIQLDLSGIASGTYLLNVIGESTNRTQLIMIR